MDARVGQFPFTQDHAKQIGGHWPIYRYRFSFDERFSANPTEIPASAPDFVFFAGPIRFPLRNRLHGVDTE
jgi:hypothetical protein